MGVWILVLIALIVSSCGFKKYVWFISLGYGFSVASIGIAMLVKNIMVMQMLVQKLQKKILLFLS